MNFTTFLIARSKVLISLDFRKLGSVAKTSTFSYQFNLSEEDGMKIGLKDRKRNPKWL